MMMMNEKKQKQQQKQPRSALEKNSMGRKVASVAAAAAMDIGGGGQQTAKKDAIRLSLEGLYAKCSREALLEQALEMGVSEIRCKHATDDEIRAAVVDTMHTRLINTSRPRQIMGNQERALLLEEKLRKPLTLSERKAADEAAKIQARLDEVDKSPAMLHGYRNVNQTFNVRQALNALTHECEANPFYRQRAWWRNAFIRERIRSLGRGAYYFEYPSYHDLTTDFAWIETQKRRPLSEMWVELEVLVKFQRQTGLFDDTQWELLTTYDIHEYCPMVFTVPYNVRDTKTGKTGLNGGICHKNATKQQHTEVGMGWSAGNQTQLGFSTHTQPRSSVLN